MDPRRACSLLLFLVACTQKGVPVEGPFPLLVGPAGGVLFNAAGVRLEIPPNALDREVLIDAVLVDDEGQLAPEASFVGPAVEFFPEDLALKAPATLTMPTSASKLADYGKSPADCLMWLKQDTGAWTQVPALRSTDTSVTVETTLLREAAVGARFQFTLTSTHPLVRDCTSPDGFCVSSVGEPLKPGNLAWSSVEGGLLAYRRPSGDGGVVALEYDLLQGKHTRESVSFVPPRAAASLSGTVLGAGTRVARSGDSVWVPLPNQGLALMDFKQSAKFFPDDKASGGTVGVVLTADGKVHRAQLLSAVGQGSSLRVRLGQPQAAATAVEESTDAVVVDAVPLFRVGAALQPGYLFRPGKRTRAVALDGGVPAPLALHPTVSKAIAQGNPIDELAVSPDGRWVAASLTSALTEGNLFLQSSEGAGSFAVQGLPNLSALEFDGAGSLYAAAATGPFLYRVDLKTGRVETVRLTASTDPAVIQQNVPQALRVLAEPGTATQKALRGLYAIVGPSENRKVLLVRRAAPPADCTTEPCENGGQCVEALGGPACLCPATATGPRCSSDVDECAAPRPPCPGNTLCANASFSSACSCAAASVDAPLCAPATARVIELVLVLERGVSAKRVLAAVDGARKLLEGAVVGGAGFTLVVGAVLDGEAVLPAMVRDPTANANTRVFRFSDWAIANAAGLTAMLGRPVDLAVLVTAAPLLSPPSQILEAFIQGAVCVDRAAGVLVLPGSVAARTPTTPEIDARVLAHGLGHALGASHDVNSQNFIMSSVYALQATGFSSESLASFGQALGQPNGRWPACLSDRPAGDWSAPHCGDGVVEGPEECDPGVGVADSCCVACRLAVGCQCANSAPCCRSGAIVAADAGVVARAARSACDVAELCDGTQGAAPFDTVVGAGAACGDAGTCLRGDCVPSLVDHCRTLGGSGACPTVPLDCSRTACSATCGSSFALPAPDGMACAPSSVCSAGQCTPTSALNDATWATSGFSACLNGTQVRTVTCRSATGRALSDAECRAGERPQHARACD